MAKPCVSAIPLIGCILATPAVANDPAFSYVPKSLVQSVIIDGPWTLHEQKSFFHHDASGIIPTTSAPPYVGDGFPYAGYCDRYGVVAKNHGPSLMQPFYFPFVRARDGVLEGYFDYRPRNEQEATVAATSNDLGATWHFKGQALALNPYCPWDPSDPDNLNVKVKGFQTAYGSDSASAADNGLGHPTVLSVNRVQRIYHLNRANGHIDSDQLVVHPLPSVEALTQLPVYGFISPLGSGGYPTLENSAKATVGLQNPDAMIGSTVLGGVTTIVYVEKTLKGAAKFPTQQTCPDTPAFALTNLDHQGTAKKANKDTVSVRVAITTDGINFTDIGAVQNGSGLYDQTTIAYNGLRWLGSGSMIRLSNGRFGMFFGGGNCLDNDSDGFHFLGYAETKTAVSSPSDLLSWKVIYGPDNPILSTDTVVDPSGPRAYPLNVPIVSATSTDALSPAQVAPWTPPASYNSNFFSGRVYDPQALYTDDHTVTIVFAGYNTPQPSSNLGDYRTIGRFQLRVPAGYFARPDDDR
jgi:hypothetical protein